MLPKFSPKMLAIILAIVFVLGACAPAASQSQAPAASQSQAPAASQSQASAQPEEPTNKIRAGVLFPIPDPRNGGGWDKTQMAGLDYLQENYGWELSIAEDVAYPKTTEVASNFLDLGYDLVIYTDNGQIESWKEAPAKYPDKWLVMCAMADELPAGSEKTAAFFFDLYAYGVIVGITAGLNTESNVIGCVGGAPSPALVTMFNGVIEGAKAVNPKAETIVRWTGDWVDVAKHRETTLLMIQEGIDTVFVISGNATKGVYEAAESAGIKAIGYGFDVYDESPGSIFVSVIKDTTDMYKQLAELYEAGQLENKFYHLDAKNMKLSDFRGSVPAEKEALIRETVEKYQNGELDVPRVDLSEAVSTGGRF